MAPYLIEVPQSICGSKKTHNRSSDTSVRIFSTGPSLLYICSTHSTHLLKVSFFLLLSQKLGELLPKKMLLQVQQRPHGHLLGKILSKDGWAFQDFIGLKIWNKDSFRSLLKAAQRWIPLYMWTLSHRHSPSREIKINFYKSSAFLIPLCCWSLQESGWDQMYRGLLLWDFVWYPQDSFL